MFSKVLFPTDFSEYARKILDCIAGFPGVRELILFHVIEETHSPRGGGEIGAALFHEEKKHLREEKHYIETHSPDIRVTTAVAVSSDTAGAIMEQGERIHASLIVVGARGKSLIEGILLGSVSLAVLRRSRTSVLIMRHKVIGNREAKSFEMFCPRILSRVLCPVDFSRYSEYAVDLVSRTDGVGEVVLFYVVSRGETKGEIDLCIRKAKDRLGEIRSVLAAKGMKARAIVRIGHPATEIMKVADEEDVSVIWMSSVGRGWFRELLIGSCADAVAVNAKRPVIIIRKKE